MANNNDISTSAPAPQKDAWSDARTHVDQLEASAQRMSSRWFFGNAGVITAAFLFLVTALVLSGSVARMLVNSEKAERAQAVMHETAALQEAIDEASVSARGFVLTHDRGLLSARRRAKLAAAAHVKEIRRLMQDNPTGIRLASDIANSILKRTELYDRLLEMKEPIITSGEVERINVVRQSNAQFTQIRQWAGGLFNEHQRRVTEDMRLSMLLALFTGIASPIFGLVGIHLLRRERESQSARELQLELMHVQRLAIMGETSAMLAHEINQPLAAASNYLAVLRRYLETGALDKALGVGERIDQQIQRAGSILRKLRRFIEKRESERSLETPEVLVEDAITLLGTIDNTVSLRTEIGQRLPHVMVDRVQLQQVLVNLMRNAIEAMQDRPERRLVLSAHAEKEKSVEISLSDSGPGLSPEVAARLFQPFVTTKRSGMGVGLSICHSIISQHGGRIWAEANPEGGTVFRFTLPAAEERVAA